MQHNMYRQNLYSRNGNERRPQDNSESQRNYNRGEEFGTGMEEQQYSDPQQNNISNQPTPQPSQGSECSASPCRVIQPDPTKREKLLAVARKEEEDYERYKASLRTGPINLTPRKLGGRTSESEARQQQQQIQAQSKYQKMIQREEYKKKQKEEEEAEIQKKKDIQRKKAERLEEKRKQENLEKMQRWDEDRCTRNSAFLDRLQPIHDPYHSGFGQSSQWPVNQEEDEEWMFQQALNNSLLMHKIEEETRVQEVKRSQHKQPRHQAYMQQQKEEEERRLREMKEEQRRKAEMLKQCEDGKRQSQEEQHRRVNSAFLDRLQRQNTSQHGYTGESNTWD
ncbi:epithelial-stromal interaction protein 1 isoform X2 [Dendropsophus ebraccatus]|uniref:epithelial-stromal interaction protein 1 isoform X2 n=1 Tax=Dendropsophus ebraccatus TaxID=150705 RepID=UPI00383147EF